jgi:multiple sugar transport system permease protein
MASEPVHENPSGLNRAWDAVERVPFIRRLQLRSFNGLRLFRLIQGVAAKVIVYALLIDVAFVFLYPLIYMAITAIKSPTDLVDPTVTWVPKSLYWDNIATAMRGLHFQQALINSLFYSVGAAVLQVISCSLTGYAFARIKMPFRETLFFLVIFGILVPPQVLMIPLFKLFKSLGWLSTSLPILVPSALGMGLRGSLFILIFRQFFRGLPWELEEAARIDGASTFRIWWQIMMPLAQPAILVVFLFSLVWHWNDGFEPMIYLSSLKSFPLSLTLSGLWSELLKIKGMGNIGELGLQGVQMAASLLVIGPPLVLYMFTQRFFTQSVERTGLVD